MPSQCEAHDGPVRARSEKYTHSSIEKDRLAPILKDDNMDLSTNIIRYFRIMNKDLNAISIFVAVAETGGFSKAAKRLGLTNSVISHHISKLEEKLEVTLFYRSTRKVSLSDQGRDFYSAVAEPLATIENALADLVANKISPTGTLNIAMPAFMPEPKIEKLLWQFAAQHAGINLDLSYSDHRQELIDNGFDLAFRLGSLESSSIKARKLADIKLKLVGAPNLFQISAPRELEKCRFVQLKQLSDTLHLSQRDKSTTVNINEGGIRVDNIYAAREAAIEGHGLTILPLGMCQSAIGANKLVDILPEWKLNTIPLYAVWHNTARRNSLIRKLLSFIESGMSNDTQPNSESEHH